MKKLCKLIAAALCLTMLSGMLSMLPLGVLAQGTGTAGGALEPTEPEKPVYAGEYYDYPITLEKDREAWIEAGSVENDGHGGWIKVCQIPEDVLEILTTEQLLKSCINYPLAWEIVAFDTPTDGLEFEEIFFNGLQELLKREDLSKTLARYYAELTEEDVVTVQDGEAVISLFDGGYVKTLYLETLTGIAAERELLDPMDSAVIDANRTRLANAYENYASGASFSYVQNRCAAALQKTTKKFLNSTKSLQYDGFDGKYYYNLTTVKTPAGSSVQVRQRIGSLA